MAPSHANNSASGAAKPPVYFRHLPSFRNGNRATSTEQIRDDCSNNKRFQNPDLVNTEVGGENEKPRQQRGFVSWAFDVKKRAQHTGAMLRDAFVSRGRVFWSCASTWTSASYKRAAKPGAASCEFMRTAAWSEEQAFHPNSSELPFRGSEVNIRMSCYSSRSLSDTEELKRHGSAICLGKSRAPSSSSETDPFRRRCSSADSYMSEARETDHKHEFDDTLELEHDDDEDDRELIRESLFARDGELYRIKSEWV